MSSDEVSPMESFRQVAELLRERAAAVRKAVSPPARGPELDAALLMGEVRAEVAAREIEIAPPDAATLALPRASVQAQPIESRDAYRLDQLLAFHDEDFIRSAYRALLRRDADPEGLARHLSMLHGGAFSRVEILGHMRRSAEGRQARVKVAGLSTAFLLLRLRRMPVVGGLLGIVLYLFRLPLIVRNIERQEVQAFRRERELRLATDALASSVESAVGALSGSAVRVAHSTTRAMRRIHQEKASHAQLQTLTEQLATLRSELALVGDGVAARPTHQDLLQLADAAMAMAHQLQAGLEGLERSKASAGDVEARFAETFTRDRIESLLRQDDHRLDEFYVAFENRFRGSREDIRERLAVYLPLVKAAGAGGAEAPVLDIGSGRGEWLELLRDHGLTGRGVDTNLVMARICRELGLEVLVGDAIDYLRTLEPNSLGAVTGMQVIEHLSFDRLVTLIDEVLRTLRPGGVAIFETPNPENLIVGACNFWYDPTHIHPLPPEGTRFIAESRGFTRVDIMRLHPYPESAKLQGGDPALLEKLNAFLYGAQDYSLVAYKI